MEMCSIADCCKPVKAKKLCSMHHQRWIRHGDPEYRRPIQLHCSKKGCTEKVLARGFCSKHYYYMTRTGQLKVGVSS